VEALQAVGNHSERPPRARRLLGRAISELIFADPENVELNTIMPLIDATLAQCGQASSALQEQYFLM
jgi:hypothetical protein